MISDLCSVHNLVVKKILLDWKKSYKTYVQISYWIGFIIMCSPVEGGQRDGEGINFNVFDTFQSVLSLFE